MVQQTGCWYINDPHTNVLALCVSAPVCVTVRATGQARGRDCQEPPVPAREGCPVHASRGLVPGHTAKPASIYGETGSSVVLLDINGYCVIMLPTLHC